MMSMIMMLVIVMTVKEDDGDDKANRYMEVRHETTFIWC